MDPTNEDADTYAPAKLTFSNARFSQTFEKVGIRPKGSASRNFVKKSWKISLTAFNSSYSLFGLEYIDYKAAAMVYYSFIFFHFLSF